MMRPRLIVVVLCLLSALPLFAQRTLVAPFEQEGGPPSGAWIGTGLAVALNEALSRGDVPIVPLESLQRMYDQEGLVPSPAFHLPGQIGLARQLGCGLLVRGGYTVSGDGISTHMEIYEVQGDLEKKGRWEEKQALAGFLALTQALGRDLFSALERPWTDHEQVSPPAFESYIRGRISEDPVLKEVYFRKAMELAPGFSDALCHLAQVLWTTGRVSQADSLLTGLRAKDYTKRYLALAILGEIRLGQGRLEEAKGLFLQSLQAAESAEGHLGMARLYLKEGKKDQARRELVMAERFETHQEEIDELDERLGATSSAPQSSRTAGSSG